MKSKAKMKEIVIDVLIQIISLENVQNHHENKDQKAFVSGSWNDFGKDNEELKKDEIFPMAQEFNGVHSDSSYYR